MLLVCVCLVCNDVVFIVVLLFPFLVCTLVAWLVLLTAHALQASAGSTKFRCIRCCSCAGQCSRPSAWLPFAMSLSLHSRCLKDRTGGSCC
jgi:hypothetical protein